MQDRKEVSQSSTSKILAELRPKRAEAFLEALANADFGYKAGWQLLELYGEFFPPTFPQQNAVSDHLAKLEGFEAHPELAARMGRLGSYPMLASLSQLLRRAWDEPDQRLKQWYIFLLRQDFHFLTNPARQTEPPALTFFEQAMVYLQGVADRAKHCCNSECPAPYFIAPRRSAKFCGDTCAAPRKQAAKREWWREHGEEWRRKRKRAATKEGAKHVKR